jgi:WD40 repeat protein
MGLCLHLQVSFASSSWRAHFFRHRVVVLGGTDTQRSQAADKFIKIWDTYTGDIIKTLHGHSEGISDVAWSSEGDFLASASDDKTVRIWDFNLVRPLPTLDVSPRQMPDFLGYGGQRFKRTHELCILRQL